MNDKNDKKTPWSDIAAVIAALAAVAGIIVTICSIRYQHKSDEQTRKRETYAEFKTAVQKLRDDALAAKPHEILEGDRIAGFLPFNRLSSYVGDARKQTIMSNYETIFKIGNNVSSKATPDQGSEITNAFLKIELTLDEELKMPH